MRSENDRSAWDRLQMPDTRIFSPLAVGDYVCRYRSLLVSIQAFNGGLSRRFYRFEHIVTYSSSKVVAKSKHNPRKAVKAMHRILLSGRQPNYVFDDVEDSIAAPVKENNISFENDSLPVVR